MGLCVRMCGRGLDCFGTLEHEPSPPPATGTFWVAYYNRPVKRRPGFLSMRPRRHRPRRANARLATPSLSAQQGIACGLARAIPWLSESPARAP